MFLTAATLPFATICQTTEEKISLSRLDKRACYLKVKLQHSASFALVCQYKMMNHEADIVKLFTIVIRCLPLSSS